MAGARSADINTPVAQSRRSSKFWVGRPAESQNYGGRGLCISRELGGVPRRATVFSAGAIKFLAGLPGEAPFFDGLRTKLDPSARFFISSETEEALRSESG